MRKILLAALLTLCVSPAWAQSPVKTFPGDAEVCPGGGVTCNNVSTTVAVTNTFQSVFTRNTTASRRDCLIQNNGTATMSVFVGPIAQATLAKSYTIGVGSWFACRGTDMVVQDQISITGTATDTFTAIQY